MAKQTGTVHLHAKVRKVGNSLAILIPAAQARKAGLAEGDGVDADIQKSPQQEGLAAALGLLKGVIPYEPFSRAEFYDDD